MGATECPWWTRASRWTPECLLRFIQQSLDSMLHAAAIAFGVAYIVFSGWDLMVLEREFSPTAFATGAAEIMAAWGTLWQVNRWVKNKISQMNAAPAPAEGQG